MFTFQDMSRTSNHYEKRLRGDNSVNIQGRIMVLEHCLSSYLFRNQVSCQSLLYYLRNVSDRHPLWKTKWLRGDNSVNIQGRIMVLVHCPSSHCHLSINHFWFKCQQSFESYLPNKVPRRTTGQSDDYMHTQLEVYNRKYVTDC